MDSNLRSPGTKEPVFVLRKANCGSERAQPKRVVSCAIPMVRIYLPPAASLEQTGSALFLGLGLARRGSCGSRRAAAALARAFSEMQAPTGPGGVERELLRGTGDFPRPWRRRFLLWHLLSASRRMRRSTVGYDPYSSSVASLASSTSAASLAQTIFDFTLTRDETETMLALGGSR
jgi:hypothetical protein